MMTTINGLTVVVHSLIVGEPKVRFNPDFLGTSTVAIENFNHWLLAQFGRKPQFIITADRIYTNEPGLESLRKLPSK